VNREFAKQDHCFARYDDQANNLLRSAARGRVAARCFDACTVPLCVELNEAKSAVASVFGRNFLGYKLAGGPVRGG
jgi:hypothetical protein